LFVRRRPALRRPARAWCRPRLEGLEERTLLNNRFVVPVGAPVDNVTTFSTLKAALTTPGLTAGNVIQIEPGSAPGAIVNANLPAVQSLTIQGDPAAAAANLPAITINDAVTIDASRAGFMFFNVNLVLQGGALHFNANAAINNSFIVSNFAGSAVTFNGTTAARLVNSQLIAHNDLGGGEVIRVNAVAGSANLITGDTISSDATVSQNLLFYNGAATTSDLVANNTFLGNAGASSLALMLIGPGVSGLTVRGNTFSDPDSNQTAIGVLSGGQNNTIADNTINLTGASGTIGITVVASSTAGTVTSAVLADNRINTGGTGTAMQLTTNSGALNVRIQGNDFHFNAIGVLIFRSHATDLASGIDLGGGSQGSQGANNFRGFSAASASAGAIVEASSFSTAQTIFAQGNLFSVANPKTVIRDSASVGGGAAVNAAGNLTGNAAFVETLYLEYLHRVGQVFNGADAGGWVNLLNAGMAPPTVARAIMNSSEALGFVVDGLYHRYLNRDSDPGGRAACISFFQRGGTLEQLTVQFVLSQEYQQRYHDDSAYVQSLYTQLLGRTPAASEVNAALPALAAVGRAGLASIFLNSTEYRSQVVRQDYLRVLDRPTAPTAGEVAGWVNSGLDLRSIEMGFAGTPEFYARG
jgi:hypothetical protein